MRQAASLVVFGVLVAVAGCGSSGSSPGTGTAGNNGSGGLGGSTGSSGTGGTSAGGTGGASTGGTGGAGGGTGGSAMCGTSNAQDQGATCNTLSAAGPCVTTTISNGTPPTPAGGTIVAGTYNVTSQTVYGSADAGTSSEPYRETVAVSGVTPTSLTFALVQVSGTHTNRTSGTDTISGTTVSAMNSCPPPGDGGSQGAALGYTATPTTVTLISSDNGVTTVIVFTKSP